jgi:hypothetical protein
MRGTKSVVSVIFPNTVPPLILVSTDCNEEEPWIDSSYFLNFEEIPSCPTKPEEIV